MTAQPPGAASAGLPWADWLSRQRWYAGGGRTVVSTQVCSSVTLRVGMELTLIDVVYGDGAHDLYQVVLQWESPPPAEYVRTAAIGAVDGRTAYDALYAPDCARLLLTLVGDSAVVDGVTFTREPGAPWPAVTGQRLLDAEQSNTSVVFSDRLIFKLFRRVAGGINPDIELNRVLGRVGNDHTARLLGTVETTLAGRSCSLGMVSEYAADAVDGWGLATAGSAGSEGLPAAESYRLGEAVASVHTALATALGTTTRPLDVDPMLSRLADAMSLVPQLRGFRSAIERRYLAAAGRQITVQRIHGDLHLGQVLRTPRNWLLIDFEGEPGQPLDQRRAPDSTLRDVAGMLRSFSYAAQRCAMDQPPDRRVASRVRAWVERAGAAFCDGYAAGSGADPRRHAEVLAVYELDKAVYEAAYEARHRPGWLPIPLEAVARLAG